MTIEEFSTAVANRAYGNRFLDPDMIDTIASVIKAIMQAIQDCQMDDEEIRNVRGMRLRDQLAIRFRARRAARRQHSLTRDDATAIVDAAIEEAAGLTAEQVQSIRESADG